MNQTLTQDDAHDAPADVPGDASCAACAGEEAPIPPPDVLPEGMPRPVAPELLDVVPLPSDITEEELREELRNWRRLVVVRVGVPVERILTVLAAIAIEAALVAIGYGIVWAGTSWLPVPGGGSRSYTTLSFDIDDGGRGSGGAPRGSAPTVSDTEVSWKGSAIDLASPGAGGSAAAIFVPELKQPDAPSVAALLDAPRDLIAMAIPSEPGVPKVRLPRPTPPSVATTVEGPTVDDAAGSAGAGASASAGGGQRAIASTLGTGDGGGEEDDLVEFVKPGKGGGVGKGVGRGMGSGFDRGPSAANSAPVVLWQPRLDLPAQYRFALKQMKRAVVFDLVVDPTGHLAQMKMKQSSGDPDLDTLLKSHVQRIKFRPAYQAGRPVSSPFVFSFGGGDEDDK